MEVLLKKKVLYVDDEYPNRITFQITYRSDLEVVLAQSADEALQILQDHNDIEVVISDLRMPGKSGLDLVKEARDIYPDMKLCLLTGFEITPEIREALDSNTLNHYFRKPFDRSEILNVVNN
ncbi:response regulator [Marinoscillum sp.]|uniref:response regulator n=1 Tax=Marinoscillum sp. TaxID=2024838 RepID=UPI003BAB6820